MSTEENKAIVRRYLEARDPDRSDEIVTANFRGHLPGNPEPLDRAGHRQLLSTFYSAFPDLHPVIEEQLVEDDRVATRLTWYGTHQGPFQGIPPTGKQIAMAMIRIDHIVNGKVAENWVSFDALGLLQQLGAAPAPGVTST
ncbi:MAG: ester cyclase [Chloroflexales bacterium]|nr:ester cyclase [Chloroflexales bacterium]